MHDNVGGGGHTRITQDGEHVIRGFKCTQAWNDSGRGTSLQIRYIARDHLGKI